ncbi:hypothetical protein [Streptomyces sp. NBC_00059]|uniref:hypothetical protein n=1 Tax=Streptomyces sp. NBC_00059 TaxID=2975635 RepID=UPI0022513796|nr:hypothetical protein [Streptomyces sp. NBC_00059]MCX5417488.1 hypothetical protein [Streptomyces sp. NBC_00059]
MDPYDSYHPPGSDRLPESSTPIYDRLLAEWREAARREAVRHPGETALGPADAVAAPRRAGAFVPAARTAGEDGASGAGG